MPTYIEEHFSAKPLKVDISALLKLWDLNVADEVQKIVSELNGTAGADIKTHQILILTDYDL